MPELAVGASVRFDIEGIKEVRPRASDELNFNSPMTVTAVDETTGMATVAREGVEVGVFPVAGLIEVETPPEEPPAIFPPDAIVPA